MSIPRNHPQIAVLLGEIERHAGYKPKVHDDFVKLASIISQRTGEYISPTTLERVWGYSTRGYENISLRTLDVLCRHERYSGWEVFCMALTSRAQIESDLFDQESISTASLDAGDVVVIGWQPNRICEIEYLGDNRFVALKAVNSKLREGDTFSCLGFQLGQPLFVENVMSVDGARRASRYGVGLRNGLSLLRRGKR